MTLVSHKYSFIFMKTFKTASTSVEGYLESYCLPENVDAGLMKRPTVVSQAGIVAARGGNFKESAGDWLGHMTAEQVCNAVGPQVWQDYTKIITTRNIFARLVSYFSAMGRDSIRAVMKRDVPRDERIQRFRRWLLLSKESHRNYQVCMIDGEPVVDMAVRFEHLNADMDNLCRTLDLPKFDPDKMPFWRHREKRRQRLGDPRDYYDAECRDFVERHYSWEIDRFGYTLENASLAA